MKRVHCSSEAFGQECQGGVMALGQRNPVAEHPRLLHDQQELQWQEEPLGLWLGQSLVKKDLEDTMNDKTWSENSRYPGEVFFIPRPGAGAEDYGVLVTLVCDGEQKMSHLLLLGGKTFTEINWSYLPFKVTFSFHGNSFPKLH